MRAAIISLAVLGLVTDAFGADLDDSFIRGSSIYQPAVRSYYNWNGFYAGGQVGYGTSFVDLSSSINSMVAFIYRNTLEANEIQPQTWSILQNQNTTSSSYGFFGGYNSQWDDVVAGLELNYNHTNINATDSRVMSRITTVGGDNYSISIGGRASVNLTDYGTLRGRLGYVMGQFMPYGFAGLAVGRVVVNQSVAVLEQVTDGNNKPVPGLGISPPATMSNNKTDYPAGFAAGVGVDMSVVPGFFLRGEYEFMQLGTFDSTRMNLQTVRVGAAARF